MALSVNPWLKYSSPRVGEVSVDGAAGGAGAAMGGVGAGVGALASSTTGNGRMDAAHPAEGASCGASSSNSWSSALSTAGGDGAAPMVGLS